MKILYFAWLRDHTGCAEEEVPLPEGVSTVGGLLRWLAGRGPQFEEVFDRPRLVRAAVNQDFAGPETPIADTDEIALFPPVTGG